MRLAAILRWDERGVEGSAKAHGICSNVAPGPVYRLLSRLPPDRRQDFFGARDPSSLLTLWNCRLETMAGCAFSTRTGGAPSLALVPQTSFRGF